LQLRRSSYGIKSYSDPGKYLLGGFPSSLHSLIFSNNTVGPHASTRLIDIYSIVGAIFCIASLLAAAAVIWKVRKPSMGGKDGQGDRVHSMFITPFLSHAASRSNG
jgi:hypothetical protein